MRQRFPIIALVVCLLMLLQPQPDTRPPLHACPPDVVAALNAELPPYTASATTSPITLRDGQFYAGDTPYPLRGVNYYPARYPWRRFLSVPLDVVEQEFDLLRAAGFNTLRVFLWYEALFQCEAEGAVPEAQGVLRFDAILQAAAAHGFRLIVTLHDLPDLTTYPLYDDPPHTRAQTEFIVRRYQDEAAILAWDLRNEGDIDYSSDRGRFTREQVLTWLATVSPRVAALAPGQLRTAGWLNDSWSTAPYVDFISFHHWADAEQLRQRIAEIRRHTDLPVLIEEVGYNTQRESLERQRDLLETARQTADQEGLLGWLVWAAFDFPRDASCFPSPCLSPDNQEHYFGIWTADYEPKPALEVLTP